MNATEPRDMLTEAHEALAKGVKVARAAIDYMASQPERNALDDWQADVTVDILEKRRCTITDAGRAALAEARK